eukprot:scaffold31481_cov90-Isochrysis_galbana.AAC.1
MLVHGDRPKARARIGTALQDRRRASIGTPPCTCAHNPPHLQARAFHKPLLYTPAVRAFHKSLLRTYGITAHAPENGERVIVPAEHSVRVLISSELIEHARQAPGGPAGTLLAIPPGAALLRSGVGSSPGAVGGGVTGSSAARAPALSTDMGAADMTEPGEIPEEALAIPEGCPGSDAGACGVASFPPACAGLVCTVGQSVCEWEMAPGEAAAAAAAATFGGARALDEAHDADADDRLEGAAEGVAD